MTYVAAAVLISGAIGGAVSSDSARKAGHTQADAAGRATALEQDQYNQTVARNAPFMAGGTGAFNTLLDRLGISGNTGATGYGSYAQAPTAAQVMATPGYQFGLDQGQTQLNKQLNARGASYSGAAAKAAVQYGNNYATGQYGNEYNRMMDQNRFNSGLLNNAANIGQSAANNTSAAGTQFAQSAGSNMIGAGNALAASSLGQSNQYVNALNQGASAYQTGNLLNRIYPQQGGSGVGANGNGGGIFGSNLGNGYGGFGDQIYGEGFGPQ